ncbi:MAG: hypothetical protein IJO32_03060 [Bacilli bacterium]|nr:hypothetical protein [Bacilli bacterium]
MEDKKKSIITIISITILVLATIGASFAYFSASGNSDTQSVTTGKINIKATSSKANAENIKPTEWSEVIASNVANEDIAQVKLSVNTFGTTVDTAKFNIYFTTDGIELNSDENIIGGSLSDLKWKLVDSTNTVIGEGDFTDGNATDPVLANTTPIDAIANAKTEEAATKTFILFIYIQNKNEQQNKLQNMSFTATLNATAQQ